MGFFADLGMKRSCVHWCRGFHGQQGKGPIARRLALTHMIDDRPEVLESIQTYVPSITSIAFTSWRETLDQLGLR